ncbi:uncharacterized protein LOC101859260 [Aplysia californica]|uniref:Uncharacterized protein LOC101859260 n=1 Tax=Aplysia californica TaxID=6500 RepID=A0ABM0JWJ5_APLCA|nr:uncharacterized protein LOC101859260 [Aplysia californica]
MDSPQESTEGLELYSTPVDPPAEKAEQHGECLEIKDQTDHPKPLEHLLTSVQEGTVGENPEHELHEKDVESEEVTTTVTVGEHSFSSKDEDEIVVDNEEHSEEHSGVVVPSPLATTGEEDEGDNEGGEEEKVCSPHLENKVEDTSEGSVKDSFSDLEVDIVKTEEETEEDMELPRYVTGCKYRWAKFVETQSKDVGFFPSYSPKDPVLLSWDEKAAAFFSSELRIVCGDHHGNLIIDGNLYPVEEFSVRTYTFEIDLFMKDDVIEDEEVVKKADQQEVNCDKQKSETKVDTCKDISSQLDGGKDGQLSDGDFADVRLDTEPKIEDIKWRQMNNQETTAGEDAFLSSSFKSDSSRSVTISKRHSPVGDDDVGKFIEPAIDSVLNGSSNKIVTGGRLHSSKEVSPVGTPERSVSQISERIAVNDELVEDVVADSSLHRPTFQLSGSLALAADLDMDVVPVRGSRPPSLGGGSGHGSAQGSARPSPAQDVIYGRPPSKASDRFSPSVAREETPSISRPSSGSRFSSANDTGSPNVMNGRTTSPVVNSVHSSARSSPLKDAKGDSLVSSRERLIDAGDISNRPPSLRGSRAGSRPQSQGSLSSEQELTQYLESGSKQDSMEHLLPAGGESHPDESLTDPAIMRGTERPTSMPNYTTQLQMNAEKRSMTPDNRIRVPPSTDVPAFRSSLVTERMEETLGRTSAVSHTSSVSSRGSSRTITPVAVENGTRESNHERRNDLEVTVSNLRKLLMSREAEVHSMSTQMQDLKDINRSLKEELDHRGRRHTPVSSETAEFKQLLSEKEILAKEVVSLREELQRMTLSQGSGSGRNSTSSGISDYSPNHPVVLQRKIGDLEAHIRDLQEVNESSTFNINKAEEKVKRLSAENKELKARALSANDLQSDSDQHLRVELRTLREDVRSLKERNFQLTEENMRLFESHSKIKPTDASISTSVGARLTSSIRSDDGVARQASAYRRDKEIAPPVSAGHYSHSRLYREDLAPKELRHSTLNRSYDSDARMLETSARLLQERDRLESGRLRHQLKENSTPKTSDSISRGSVLYSDRSRPDGEVSEKLHADKYSKTSSSIERKSYEDTLQDRGSSLYLDKHLHRDLQPRSDHRDKYRHTSDAAWDREARVSTTSRSYSSGATFSSKDIFFSLQQKRANQWPQSAVRSQCEESDEYDSDSTMVLMSGHREEPAGELSAVTMAEVHRISEKERKGPYFDSDNKYISGNLDFQKLSARTDDTADDSDTATDILLAQDGTARGIHQRRTSVGSNGSLSSLSDVDEPSDSALRRRSKSVDAHRGLDSSRSRQMTTLHRSGSATRPLSSIDSARSSAGHRSVLPAPMVTQHNKGEITSKGAASLLGSSLTHGMRPFAPRSPADVRPEDVIKFSRQGGKLTQGVVKFVGHLPGRGEAYLGVELDRDEGKHDGTFEGIRYFKCKPSKGVFVAFNKVVMAWAP